MKLHTSDTKFFSDTIRAASQHLNIKEIFVEKDYWITLVLNRLSKTKYAGETVFKGGTSLSKGFGLINRFSEDVDIAIINAADKSGNEIKSIIRQYVQERFLYRLSLSAYSNSLIQCSIIIYYQLNLNCHPTRIA